MTNPGAYPMMDGGPLFRPRDLVVLVRRILKRLNRARSDAAVQIDENLRDRVADFTEYSACVQCGSSESREVLQARDGNRVVECAACGLWFTSPRIPEERWQTYLGQADEERNITVTENRLRHGMALTRNVRYAFSFWWRLIRRREMRAIRELIALHGSSVVKVHDVGCGVGFFLQAARDMGLEASGNDLNAYAVRQMKQALGLEAHHGDLPALVKTGKIPPDSVDIVNMHDMIEHVYDPVAQFRAAHDVLRPGGILAVTTFCIDSDIYRAIGKDWSMFMWNHLFHFSSSSLARMIESSGFEPEQVRVDAGGGVVSIIARRPR